jgi:internalin A
MKRVLAVILSLAAILIVAWLIPYGIYRYVQGEDHDFHSIINGKLDLEASERKYLSDFIRKHDIDPSLIKVYQGVAYYNYSYINIENGFVDEINFSSLGLTQIPDPYYFKKLEKLSAHSNKIKRPEISGKAPSLKLLVLNYNQISEIEFLEQLPNLEYLSLISNQVSAIKTLSALTQLKYLDLSYNQLTDLIDFALHLKLNSLNLDNNQLSDISVLANALSLKELRLGNNRIMKLQGLGSLEKLQSLFVKGNPGQEIPPALKQRLLVLEKD